MSFCENYNKFLNELENSSIGGYADNVRDRWKDSDALKAHQAILGNFWDHPALKDNWEAVVRCNGYALTNPAMFANRLAAGRQLLNSGLLSERETKTIEHHKNVVKRHTIEATKTFVNKLQKSLRLRTWAEEILENRTDVKGAVVNYLMGGLGSQAHNLFAMYLVSALGNINDNCDALFTNKEFMDWVNEALKTYKIKPHKNDTQVKLLIKLLPGYAKTMIYKDVHLVAYAEQHAWSMDLFAVANNQD